MAHLIPTTTRCHQLRGKDCRMSLKTHHNVSLTIWLSLTVTTLTGVGKGSVCCWYAALQTPQNKRMSSIKYWARHFFSTFRGGGREGRRGEGKKERREEGGGQGGGKEGGREEGREERREEGREERREEGREEEREEERSTSQQPGCRHGEQWWKGEVLGCGSRDLWGPSRGWSHGPGAMPWPVLETEDNNGGS